MTSDPYRVLGVAPTASAEELKAAHRSLVRRHHPDLQPASERAAATRRIQDVNVAYGMVRDPHRRAAIDDLLRTRSPAPSWAADWDARVTEAGRWAGIWWRRNRASLARAGAASRRAALGLVGRLVWLGSSVAGTVAGFVLSVAVSRPFVEAPLFATLAGTVGGLVAGSEYGARTARRLAGDRPPRWVMRAAVIGWLLAVGIGVVVDRAVR